MRTYNIFGPIASLLLALLLLTSIYTDASAIPAFARKYKLSCATCHVSVPKIKDYGEDFAANGFLLPDGEEPRRTYIETGDDELMLMRELPIAVRFDAFIQAADRSTARSDFQVPYGLKLLSGGSIARNVSYYFYFYIDERGEVAGLEDAYVHFNNIAKSQLDIMVGQFQVSDPLFKRELRLTFEDYQIYRTQPGQSRADLTYDRGVMLTYGFSSGLDLSFQVLNGNGIGPAENRLFDFDSEKTFAGRATQSVGPVRVGVFAYRGKEKAEIGRKNTVTYYGPDATFSADKFEVNAQFLHRKDDNPFFEFAGSEIELDGGFVEFIYLPQGDLSKWIVTALYNRVEGTGQAYDYETATLTLSRMMARNLRLLGEFTFDMLTDKPIFTLGFVSAF